MIKKNYLLAFTVLLIVINLLSLLTTILEDQLNDAIIPYPLSSIHDTPIILFKIELLLASIIILSYLHYPKIQDKITSIVKEKRVLFSLMIILALTPIWFFQYLPTSDGPNHLMEVQILRQYDNPEFNYPEYFVHTSPVVPNMFLQTLGLVFGFLNLLTVEKIFLSLVMVLTPLGVYYFLGAFKDTQGKEFISLLFLFTLPLSMGFYNYLLGIAFVFFTLGYYLRNKGSFDLKKALTLLALFVLCFFTHLSSFLFASSMIILLIVFKGSGRQKKIVLALAAIILLSFLLLPQLRDLLNAVVQSKSTFGLDVDTPTLWLKFYKLYRHLTPYSIIGLFSTIFLALLLLYNIVVGWRSKENRVYAKLFIVYAVAYILSPSGLLNGYLDVRIITPMFLLLLPWLKITKKQQGLIIALISIVFLFILAEHFIFYEQYNELITRFNSGIEYIESNSEIYPMVFFNKPKYGSTGADPLNTAVCYYSIAKGGGNPIVYALPGMNLIKYKWYPLEGSLPIVMDSCEDELKYDYFVTWDTDFPYWYCGNFKLKYTNKELKIYGRI